MSSAAPSQQSPEPASDERVWSAPQLKRIALPDAELGPGILDDADFSLT